MNLLDNTLTTDAKIRLTDLFRLKTSPKNTEIFTENFFVIKTHHPVTWTVKYYLVNSGMPYIGVWNYPLHDLGRKIHPRHLRWNDLNQGLGLAWVLPNFILLGTDYFEMRVLEMGFNISCLVFLTIFLGGERWSFLFSLKNSHASGLHLKMEGSKTFSWNLGGVSAYFQGLLLLGKSECKDVFFSGRRVDISWIFMVPNLPPTCFGENSIEIPCELPCWTEGTISAWTSSGSICVLAERTCVPARRHAPFSNWWFQLGIF